MLSRTVEVIEPRYWANVPNSPIELATRHIRLDAGGISANGMGVARLEMAPRDRVVVTVTLEATPATIELAHHRKKPMQLWFGDTGAPCKVLAMRSQFRSEGDITMDLLVSSGGFLVCRDRRANCLGSWRTS